MNNFSRATVPLNYSSFEKNCHIATSYLFVRKYVLSSARKIEKIQFFHLQALNVPLGRNLPRLFFIPFGPYLVTDCREGVVRLVSWNDPRCGRMLPVWVLIPPQVIMFLMLRSSHNLKTRVADSKKNNPNPGQHPANSDLDSV